MTNSITVKPKFLGGLDANMAAQIAAANEEARTNWDDPTWRLKMATAMTEAIYDGFEHENLLDLMTDVERVDEGERITVKETRGLRAYFLARGGAVKMSSLTDQVFDIQPDNLAIGVEEFEDKMRLGFVENQAKLVELAVQRFDAAVNQRLLALFQQSINATTNTSSFLSSGNLTLATVNTAIREVRDASITGGITIVGRAAMTEQIIDLVTGADGNNGAPNAYLPETNEQLVSQGVMGSYKGARIVTLRNFRDEDDSPFWPNNEMYVIGRDGSKFGFWGGLKAKESVDGDNWYWRYVARREFGGVVHRPDRIRRIIDTSVSL